jgi:hypothetical protein
MIQPTTGFEKTAQIQNMRAEPNLIGPQRIASHDTVTTAIALLSDNEIESMDRSDLLDGIRIAQTRQPLAATRPINDLDDTRLRWVMYLVRLKSRMQVDENSTEKGWVAYFGD